MERTVFAERVALVNRHLRRVEQRLPIEETDLKPMSDATDAVILHLWQAVQVVIDIATSLCVKRGLGVPPTYGDAFRLLARDDAIPESVAENLARAAGFRNLIVRAYADLDLVRIHRAAKTGPAQLREFLAAVKPTLNPAP